MPTSPSSQPSMAAAHLEKDTPTPSPDADVSDGDDSSVQSGDEDAPSNSARSKGKATDSSGETVSVPLQKRRRVTRACDECRRKKIKCDGKQPCTHCQVYSYDCTYDKPSNRRRNPAPQYIEALEDRLQRAEALLRTVLPNVDLNDPDLDPTVQQEFRLRQQARSKEHRRDDESSSSSIKSDERLVSMISGVGQLELDDKGEYAFHGLSSGAVFFRRMKDHFRTLLGRDYHIPVLPRPPRPSGILSLDSPRSSAANIPKNRRPTSPDLCDLPSIEISRQLCSYSLNYATCLLRIVHIPSFYEMLDNIYRKPPGNYGTDDNRNLALLYSVMALGCMYTVPEDKASNTSPFEIASEQGLKYYASARFLLQDITECRDLTSLQALLFMILFIQSVSNLSTCYGFVGIALRSALRMGLHRNIPHAHQNAIESESRRRVFSVCRQLDIYVSALLGFPMLLNDEDIDQPLPTPVDDEYITKAGILPVRAGTTSFFEAFNAHAQLMDILSKIIKHIYPLKGIEQSVAQGGEANTTYIISFTKVKEMEVALQQWNEQLPVDWRPNSNGPEEVVRVRNLLRFAFAHVQMVLYRPFLHYVSPRVTASKQVDNRSYACGAAGINVARNIVRIGIEMRKQVSLVGPYWFTLFTEFFAIISLVFYVLENEDKPGTAEIMADAAAGRDMIDKLARRTLAAGRISKSLEILFDQLPQKMKKVKPSAAPSKKRSAPGSKGTNKMTPSSGQPQGKPSSRRVEKHGRKGGSLANQARGSAAPDTPGTSFGIDTQIPGFGLDDFTQGLQAVSPLDLTSTPPQSATSLFPKQEPHQQRMMTGGLNQLNQLDAMMFPSEDPLEYPNQPAMELGHPQPNQTASPGSSQHIDPSQFYMPNLFDGIEGQLLGPLPPYLMQAQGQPGFGFPTQMFSEPMLLQHDLIRGHQPVMPNMNPALAQHQQRQQQQRGFSQFSNPPWSGTFQYE